MRRESKAERAAWTEYVTGQGSTCNKYGAVRSGKYASKREEKVAANLHALASRGLIQNLKEQVRITLVPGDGKIRPVIYVADFTYRDMHGLHVLDAKGYRTPIYRLKKRLAALLLGITIEEV